MPANKHTSSCGQSALLVINLQDYFCRRAGSGVPVMGDDDRVLLRNFIGTPETESVARGAVAAVREFRAAGAHIYMAYTPEPGVIIEGLHDIDAFGPTPERKDAVVFMKADRAPVSGYVVDRDALWARRLNESTRAPVALVDDLRNKAVTDIYLLGVYTGEYVRAAAQGCLGRAFNVHLLAHFTASCREEDTLKDIGLVQQDGARVVWDTGAVLKGIARRRPS